VVAAVVASGVAFLASGLPYGFGLMAGAVPGIGAGMLMPERRERGDG